MEENPEHYMELFSQDGVLLKQAPSYYINYINVSGTLYLMEYLNSNKTRFIEWKPNKNLTISSDTQDDQEWAVVDTIGSNHEQRSKYIKINMKDVKSFKVSRKSDRLSFYDGKCDILCNFFFQHGNSSSLVGALKGILKTSPARRDKNLFVILDDIDQESRQLAGSFAELNLFQDSKSDYYVWNFMKNFPNKPYETTLEAFSKITDIVIHSPEQRHMDQETQDILNKSLTEVENGTTTRTQDEYEVIAHVPKLPDIKDYPRGGPLTQDQWYSLQDHEGKIEDIEFTKLHIFRGGVASPLRNDVWKFLLDYLPWDSNSAERQIITKQKCEEYYIIKAQWKTLTKMQEDNFSDFRERKSLIEKDVNRTDRTLNFYAGDNNPNVLTLYEILMTYVMYNFDLGYVQGMSDLLSPILYLFKNEVDAFWCFVGFMNKVSTNFDMDQAGMKEQLENLHTLLGFAEPQLVNYLDRHDSGNMFFCFRWLLVWFKRELSQDDVMTLWEVVWTGLPCQNFHLLICVAILQTEKDTLIENQYGFTEILKHINDLSGHLDISVMLNKAEGIFNQIKSANHLTDDVRIILGLPLLGIHVFQSSPNDSTGSLDPPSSLEAVTIGDTEVSYERAISSSYL